MSDEAPIPAAKQTDDEILEEARKRYGICLSAESENHEKALSDLRFLAGEHWDEKDKTQRTIAGRPALTINKLPTFLHQITNEQRINKPGIKVHPVDDNADEETAEVEQGLIRHIEYATNAGVAYTRAVNSAAAVGFGYFVIGTRYCKPDSFDQECYFRSIRNPLAVKIDPLAQEPDASDQGYCFIESQMARDDFKIKYPDAEANNLTLFQHGTAYQHWLSNSTVLVAEYYRRTQEKATLCERMNGQICYKDELPKGETPKRTRESYRQKIEWFKITGVDILERTEILCDWIPVIPIYGDEIDIEGKVTRFGMVRNSKDPSMMYDYWMTSATEEVAMRNKTPYIGAEGQFKGYEDDWAQANTTPFSYLQYVPVTIDGNLAPAPQRQPMTDVPQGVLAMAMHANDNIKATTGLFDSSLGARGNATSGIQERAQQRQGDQANAHYTDNQAISVRHAGRCLLSMIPHYYDAERSVRILGEDGTAKMAKINTPIPPEEQEKDEEGNAIKTVLNDMTVGEYDLTVSTGPSYDTMRQEALDGMIEVAGKWPKLMEVAGDKVIRAMDWPGADEIADRVKKTLPPGLADDPQEGDAAVQTPKGPVSVEQASHIIAMLEQNLNMAHEALQKAGTDKQALEQAQLQIKQRELEIKDYEAQTARLQAEADQTRAQAEAAAPRPEPKTVTLPDGVVEDFDVWKAKLDAAKAIEIAEIGAKSALDRIGLQAEQAAHQELNEDLSDDGSEAEVATQRTAQRAAPIDKLAQMHEAQMQAHQQAMQAHAQTADAIGQLAQAVARPKTIVRGPDGRVAGVQ